MEPDKLMTVREAAEYLGVTRKHIHAAICKKSIGHTLVPNPSPHGHRFIRAVSKNELDSVRADGFFRSSK